MNLFNKYRPKTLDEVKGQDFVVSTLKNKIPHTLLFTSSLGGTGKTSTACILANELNALHIEVDAASNNSVENVRNLIEQCRQRPLGFKNIFVTVDECFWKNSKVATLAGYKNICDIQVGDIVASFPTSNVVERVLKKKVPFHRMIWLKFNDGTITLTTVEHKYCTVQGEWKCARDLTSADKLYEINSQSKYVIDSFSHLTLDDRTLRKYFRREEINKGYAYFYDLTVRDSHNYFVNDVLVHNCSRYNKSTWDVFLKFIEQPPDYVYLCFCTTDLEKVPDTIRSRCTHFEFKPIDTSVIIDQLKYICNTEGKPYEDKALELLAGYAKHSLRQAISNLELVFSQDITTDVVIKNVIKASYSDMMNLTFAYLDGSVSNIMSILNNISDMQSFIEHYFTFILDLRIFHKTSRMDLTSLPQIVYNDIREINSSEWEMIDNLCEELFHLQWEGKHSPVLKELFLSRLF